MGLWGAAQAIAFALGGFLGTVAVDVMRYVIGTPAIAYAFVFAGQGLMFLVAAMLAAGIEDEETDRNDVTGEVFATANSQSIQQEY